MNSETTGHIGRIADYLKNTGSTPRVVPVVGSTTVSGLRDVQEDFKSDLMRECSYPSGWSNEIANVAQFYTYTQGNRDVLLIRDKYQAWLEKHSENFTVTPTLASLVRIPFKFYFTTQPTNVIRDAITEIKIGGQARSPKTSYFRWWEPPNREEQQDDQLNDWNSWNHADKTNNPIIYHVFGHLSNEESLLLLDDDYKTFLRNFIPTRLHSAIQRMLSTSAILFVGFEPTDTKLHVMLNSLITRLPGSESRKSVMVQLASSSDPAYSYFYNYYDARGVTILDINTGDFLRRVLKAYNS